MTLLIDGYNVLHTPMPPLIAGLDEVALGRCLASSRWAKRMMFIVLDGVVKPGVPERSPVAGVTFVWSGRAMTADEWIIAHVHRDSAARRCTVVSSDRAIQKAVRRRKAETLSSQQFIQLLARDVEAQMIYDDRACTRAAPLPVHVQQVNTPSGAQNARVPAKDDVDAWLKAFNVTAEDEKDARTGSNWYEI